MAYIGRQPTVGNFQICDAISVVNGQAAYTMQVGGVNVSPESANHMLVSLNGILQAPTSSFTVSGSTITFASNLVTGDVINFIQILGNVLDLGVPSDSTVSIAKLTATGTKNSTTFLRGDNTFNAPPLGGITMADQWRMTSNITSSQSPLTNVEQVDNAAQGTLGSAMTQSSGIFTFPETGIYRVTFSAYGATSGSDNVGLELYVSTDGGSNYTNTAQCYDGNDSSHSISMYCETFVDVTSTSNVKVKFDIGSVSAATVYGSTTLNNTVMTFIRLGDT